jgi:hypothetical protein
MLGAYFDVILFIQLHADTNWQQNHQIIMDFACNNYCIVYLQKLWLDFACNNYCIVYLQKLWLNLQFDKIAYQPMVLCYSVVLEIMYLKNIQLNLLRVYFAHTITCRHQLATESPNYNGFCMQQLLHCIFAKIVVKFTV